MTTSGTPPTGPDAPPAPVENVQRGVAVSLVVVPLGIVVWDLLWSFGFVASIVAFGVAWGAIALYRLGSGGVLRRPGAIAVTVVTVGTLVLAFVSGFAVDIVGQYATLRGVSIPEALVEPAFWGIVLRAMAEPQSLLSLLLAAVFGFLGCFTTLRRAFRQTRPAGSQPPVRPDQDPSPRLTQDDDPRG